MNRSNAVPSRRQSNEAAYGPTSIGTMSLAPHATADRYNAWLLGRVRSALGSRVLDVGSGTGNVTKLLMDRELVVGIDVVDQFVTDLARDFADRPNAHFLHHDISASTGDLERFRFDSAVSFNVFEHIEDDQSALRNVHQILQPGGAIGLVVPAHPWLHGQFDDLIGHCRRYTTRALGRKLEAAGFSLEHLAYSNPLGALGWLVQVRLLGKGQVDGAGLFDRLVPVLAALERPIRPPFGLSVVAVARKRA
jgi:SAM-dependent methyltransferase